MEEEALIAAAKRYRGNAVSRRSGFSVGAAIEDEDGKIWGGCNVENSTYGLSMCAERVAIFKAVSEGSHEITKVAVVTDHETITPPCGCCRQMIWEFASDETEVLIANLEGDVRKFEIKELLPEAFGARFLEGVR